MIFVATASLAASIVSYSGICATPLIVGAVGRGRGPGGTSVERLGERLELRIATGDGAPLVLHDAGTAVVEGFSKSAQPDIDDPGRFRKRAGGRTGQGVRRRGLGGTPPQDGQSVAHRGRIARQDGDPRLFECE